VKRLRGVAAFQSDEQTGRALSSVFRAGETQGRSVLGDLLSVCRAFRKSPLLASEVGK